MALLLLLLLLAAAAVVTATPSCDPLRAEMCMAHENRSACITTHRDEHPCMWCATAGDRAVCICRAESRHLEAYAERCEWNRTRVTLETAFQRCMGTEALKFAMWLVLLIGVAMAPMLSVILNGDLFYPLRLAVRIIIWGLVKILASCCGAGSRAQPPLLETVIRSTPARAKPLQLFSVWWRFAEYVASYLFMMALCGGYVVYFWLIRTSSCEALNDSL